MVSNRVRSSSPDKRLFGRLARMVSTGAGSAPQQQPLHPIIVGLPQRLEQEQDAALFRDGHAPRLEGGEDKLIHQEMILETVLGQHCPPLPAHAGNAQHQQSSALEAYKGLEGLVGEGCGLARHQNKSTYCCKVIRRLLGRQLVQGSIDICEQRNAHDPRISRSSII